jgi:DNA-binding MarR family transcriptional regulator
MTDHGLVEWSRPAHDGRGKWIVASALGRRRYERLRRALVRDNERLLASYSKSARSAAISVLRRLAERATGKAGDR